MLVRNVLLGILLLLFLAAPASAASLLSNRYTSDWSSSGFFPLGTTSYRIGKIQNETGHDASFDLLSYLREQVGQQLALSGLSEETSTIKSANSIVVELNIYLYQEGSTFGRWLGGGAGTAYAVIHATFHKNDQAPGAELLTISIISGAGLFSAGAEKTVLMDAAEEIATFLKNGGNK